MAGYGVDAGDEVFDFLEVDVFPGAGIALGGAADAGFGGFATGLGDFIEGHADGDLIGGDDFLDGDLAFVELAEFRDEVFFVVGEGPGSDPAGDAVAGALAADAIDFCGHCL